MFGRGLIVVGGAVGGAGVYGFLLYDFPWWLAVLCLLGALALIGTGYLLGGKIASIQDASRSPLKADRHRHSARSCHR